uniref:Uncharacterized protein n=1 Tax=Avena sativa TaxID=4498 RepID=A0ACD5Z185_AVESA
MHTYSTPPVLPLHQRAIPNPNTHHSGREPIAINNHFNCTSSPSQQLNTSTKQRLSLPVDRPSDQCKPETNPHDNMEYQGQHGRETNKVEEYGKPVAGHGGFTGGPTGTHGAAAAAGTGTGTGAGGQFQPMKDDHKTDGLLRRSGSSSSSSSEDDGVGGRRRKGMKEKIKEKLPGGGHKTEQQQQQTAVAGEYAGTHGAEATGGGEKKGVMDKIKEKLPGGQH